MKFLVILSCLILYVTSTCNQRCNAIPRNVPQDFGRGKHKGLCKLRECHPIPNFEMWYLKAASDTEIVIAPRHPAWKGVIVELKLEQL